MYVEAHMQLQVVNQRLAGWLLWGTSVDMPNFSLWEPSREKKKYCWWTTRSEPALMPGFYAGTSCTGTVGIVLVQDFLPNPYFLHWCTMLYLWQHMMSDRLYCESCASCHFLPSPNQHWSYAGISCTGTTEMVQEFLPHPYFVHSCIMFYLQQRMRSDKDRLCWQSCASCHFLQNPTMFRSSLHILNLSVLPRFLGTNKDVSAQFLQSVQVGREQLVPTCVFPISEV